MIFDLKQVQVNILRINRLFGTIRKQTKPAGLLNNNEFGITNHFKIST